MIKIKHRPKDFPKRIDTVLSDKENRFFRSLELSDRFDKKIMEIRNRFGIQAKGESVSREHDFGPGIPKFLNREEANGYLADINSVIKDFGFPPEWEGALMYFVNHSYMPKEFVVYGPGIMVFGGDTLVKILGSFPLSARKNKLAIVLNQQLSQHEFVNLIHKEWERIESAMGNLPKRDRNRQQNIQIASEISRLKKTNPGIKWPEITDKILESHPELNDPDNPRDEGYFQVLWHRYTKRKN